MPEPSYFARRLKEERERKGWSQRALAAAAGINHQMVSFIELGHCDPGWQTAVALADALGVSLDIFREPVAGKVERKLPGKPGRPRNTTPPPAKPTRAPKPQRDSSS